MPPKTSRTGRQIVRMYQPGVALDNKCYRDSYKRVRFASTRAASTRPLPPWDPKEEFCRLWGNLIKKDGAWKGFPEEYRGKGAPGALASRGWATIIDKVGIWAGGLSPGAVLQTWKTLDDFERAKEGEKAEIEDIGHSFIFIRYVRRGPGIVGMKVADNGYHRLNPRKTASRTVKPDNWGVWFAANVG